MKPLSISSRKIQMFQRQGARIAAACPSLRQQQQRLPTPPPSYYRHTTRSFASRTNDQLAQIEEQQHHLGKQLSRPSENATLHHPTWINTVKTKFAPHNYHKATPTGLNHYNAARYEHEGLAEIHNRSYDANVLLEIRDVRVPASSHHPSFTRLARHRTHLICYTHADLIDESTRNKVEEWTKSIWPESRSIFVDTRSEMKSKDTLHYFDKLYDGLLRNVDERGNNLALTVGVANVGKSSVLMSLLRLGKQRGLLPNSQVKINVRPISKKKNKKKGKAQLRRGGMPGVLDTPGKTREITEYLLRDKPRAYFMDVPGITPPAAFFRERPEAWFGYGATNLLPMGIEAQRDVEMNKSFCKYILSCANRDGLFHYVDSLNLNGPTDDIDEALSKLSNKYKEKLGEEKLWLKRCETFLKLYNTGNFGPLILDDMKDTSWQPFVFRDEHFSKKGGTDFSKKGPNDSSKKGPNDYSKKGPNDFSKKGPNDFSKKGPNDVSKKSPNDFSKKGPNDFSEKSPNVPEDDKVRDDGERDSDGRKKAFRIGGFRVASREEDDDWFNTP